MAEQHYRTTMPAPSLGVNNSDDIWSVLPSQVYRAVNCHLSESGILYTRGGCRTLNSTALDGAVTSIYDFQYAWGGTTRQLILVTAGSYLYQWNPDNSTFESIKELSTTDRPTWATFYDGSGHSNAFMCNGTDFFRYDGVEFNDITFVTGKTAPRYILVYDDRMLAAGMDSDPYDVQVSESLDGTDWLWGDPEAEHYWSVNSATGDRIRGLGKVYDFGVFFQRNGIDIITGADTTSSSTEQLTVSYGFGTTSHWSIQTQGNMIYFADESHLYRGELRQAVENGLEVKPIDRNIRKKYKTVRDFSDIVSVYDDRFGEIVWGVQCGVVAKKDTGLVYSVENSGVKIDMGWVDVWSGWWETSGYYPHTFGIVLNSDSKPEVWRGDSDGYVYIMEELSQQGTYEQHKDYSAATAVDINTEIVTNAVMPGGVSAKKQLRQYTPLVSQFVNDSTYIQWLVDGSYIKPDTDRQLTLTGNIPYWNDTSKSSTTTLWGGSIWAHNEYVIRPVSVTEPFRYIQIKILNDGSNARDLIRYAGGELLYQIYRHTHLIQG